MALFVMMMIIVYDILIRTLFRKTFIGALETVELLLVIVIFSGLARSEVEDRHIRVGILLSCFSQKIQSLVETLIYFMSLMICLIMTWQAVVEALVLRNRGAISSMLRLPIYPFVFLMALCLAIFSMALLVRFIGTLTQLLQSGSRLWVWLIPGFLVILLLFLFPIWGQKVPFRLSPQLTGLCFLVVLFSLLFLKVHIGFAMAVAGMLGMAYLNGLDAGLRLAGITLYAVSSSYIWSVVPLFMLMGIVCSYTGLARELYNAAYRWFGHLPGGLAMATTAGCAGFAAVSGDSLSGAIAMGSVTLPEMRRYKYGDKLATGCVAAGGTLGLLIPPSLGFMIYGIITEQSIGALFISGILPGILLSGLFMLIIYLHAKIQPGLAPPGEATSIGVKIRALKGTWGILALFLLVIGGIYGGVFAATQAGAVGALGAILLGLLKRNLNWGRFREALRSTVEITSVVFLILICAVLFGYFLAITKLPFYLADLVATMAAPKLVVLIVILSIYMLLGCLMNSIPAVILTLPVIYPTVVSLGYNPIWFGVLLVILVEMGQITPPIGMNVFAIAGVARDVPMEDIFKGILPFWAAMVLCIVILIIFPDIALFLPGLMAGK
jgi:tripartite ATP-independent transporter DctM subunit